MEKVTQVKKNNQTDEHNNQDILYEQKVTGTIQNGKSKGQKIQLTNDYSYSQLNDQSLARGDQVFVSLNQTTTTEKMATGEILGVKRDSAAVLMLLCFIFLLVLIGRKSGIYALISSIVNVVLLTGIITLYIQIDDTRLLYFTILLTFLFTLLSLLFISGWTVKTQVVTLATLISTFTAFLFSVLVFSLFDNKGLHFEEMGFLTRPYYGVFLSGLLIGSLGAVMDVAITIISSMFELYEKDPQIEWQKLRDSGLHIGQDIMGAMSNVLLFTYISGSIPVILLYLRNQMYLGYSISLTLSLEMARFLVGSIGIVLTVPISIYCCLFFIKKGRRKE